MARPSKLTPARHECLVTALRAGHTRKLACTVAGISYVGFLAWMRRGEADADGSEPYRSFARDVRLAEAEAAGRWLGILQEAFTSDWRAAAWYLEHRFPEDWGRPYRTAPARTATKRMDAWRR